MASPTAATFDQIIVDPSLVTVLRTSAEALAECQRLLDLLAEHAQAAAAAASSASTSSATAATLSSDPHASSRTISLAQKRIFAYLAKLRGLNRDAVLRVRATKQLTADARAEIDGLHLHLQNLYYKQRHLQSEIAACENYPHRYTALPLLEREEFLARFPQHAQLDEDGLMIARIEHELAEREALEQQRQELLAKKESLIAENRKRKEELARLDADLEKYIEAAKPIQKILEKER
ncbi:hypothetical protein KEM52_002229 [Ascosphaera acerosa]|nr:hypothetical protein KEM52_002229 [Ascosphaera acerosa]